MSSSNLSFDPLRHPSTVSSLQTLARILQTSIGPAGHLKLLDNTRALTSSSQRLLYHISIKNFISKIVVSTAKNQLKAFNDGGLACAVLALNLVSMATAYSGRSLPLVGGFHENFKDGRSLPLVGTLYEIFAEDFLHILRENSSFAVDFSNLNNLKSVVLTVLSSKPGCLLSRFDRDHLCSIILKAFLDSIPTDGKSVTIQDCFRFVTVNGLPPGESKLLKGALVQISENEKNMFEKELFRKGPIKIALFTCSLAGDADWPVDCVETTSKDIVVDTTLKLLNNLVLKLVSDGVDLVLCQKVVHPRMKKQMQKAGILFIDRLGTETAKCIQYVCGGNSIASLACELSYGTVSNISIEHLGSSSFLLLSSANAPLFSIVLVHYNEESCAEVKVVCRQAMDSLLRILHSPKVCFGGGCSEICTGILLANKVKSNLDTISKATGCTSSQVLESLTTFLRGITSTSVAIHQGKVIDFATEGAHGHLWRLHDGQFPSPGDRCQCRSHDATSIDQSSWLLLSDLSNLYGAIPLTSDAISLKSRNVAVVKETAANVAMENSRDGVMSADSPIADVRLPSTFDLSEKGDAVSLNARNVSVVEETKHVAMASSRSLATEMNLLEEGCDCPMYNSRHNVSDLLSNDSPVEDSLLPSSFVCLSPTNPMPSKLQSELTQPVKFDSTPSIVCGNSPTIQISKNDCPANQISENDIPSVLLKTAHSGSKYSREVKTSVPLIKPISNTPKQVFHVSSIADNSDAPPKQVFQESSVAENSPSNQNSEDFVRLDELTCKLSSFSLAFETASLLLRTTVCINNLPT